jgi:hypothetical protein
MSKKRWQLPKQSSNLTSITSAIAVRLVPCISSSPSNQMHKKSAKKRSCVILGWTQAGSNQRAQEPREHELADDVIQEKGVLLLLPPGHLPNQLPKLPVGSLDEGTTDYCDYIDHGCCGATRWGRRREGVLNLVGRLWRRMMLLDGHSLSRAAPNLFYVWPLAAEG